MEEDLIFLKKSILLVDELGLERLVEGIKSTGKSISKVLEKKFPIVYFDPEKEGDMEEKIDIALADATVYAESKGYRVIVRKDPEILPIRGAVNLTLKFYKLE